MLPVQKIEPLSGTVKVDEKMSLVFEISPNRGSPCRYFKLEARAYRSNFEPVASVSFHVLLLGTHTANFDRWNLENPSLVRRAVVQ